MTDLFTGLITMWNGFDLLGTGNSLLTLVAIAILVVGTQLEIKDKMLLTTGLYSGAMSLGLINNSWGITLVIILTIMTILTNFEE